MAASKIYYKIPLLKQSESSNCVQTSVSMLINHYGFKLSPGEIQANIPVRLGLDGKPYGTLLTDIAIFLKSFPLSTILHCFDTEIIDRSWKNLNSKEIIGRLKKLRSSNRETVVSVNIRNIMIDSYIAMLNSGQSLKISKLGYELFRELIYKGPFLSIVSYNYLYGAPRDRYVLEHKKYETDDIEGKTTAHAVLVTGMDNKNIYINDPDESRGGQNIFPYDHFIAAIATAQNKATNLILAIC